MQATDPQGLRVSLLQAGGAKHGYVQQLSELLL